MKDLDEKFIDMYRQVGTIYGLNDVFITLFAKLYLEPEEVAMEDLVKMTGYSLASVSNNIKILQQTGLVTKRRKPGSNKYYVYMEKDLTKLVKGVLLEKQHHLFRMIIEHMPEIINEYKKKARTDKQKQKLKILEEYLKQIHEMEKLTANFIEAMENIKR